MTVLAISPLCRLLAAPLVVLGLLAVPAAAQDRALIIGVGAFADLRLGRPASVDGDIARMEKLVRGRLGFEKDEIRILKDAQATKAAVLDAITDWLRPDRKEVEERRADEEKIRSGKLSRQQVRALERKWRKAGRGPKRSYLYFAGPGFFQRDLDGEEDDRFDETLIPYDATVTGEGKNETITGMISDDEFSEAIKSLEGREVTIVLDTSHAGWVSRAQPADGGLQANGRVPDVADAARTIAPDTALAERKGEGSFVEVAFEEGTLEMWAAASPGQTAQVDHGGPSPGGLFTRLYVEGLTDDAADANGNGYLSNAELLIYIADRMQNWCEANASRCEMGLAPRLDPLPAFAFRAAPGKRPDWYLTLTRFQDFLVRGAGDEIELTQDPPSPVMVGDANLRFTARAPHDGKLILLTLTEGGHLMQLYPSVLRQGPEETHAGRVAANAPVAIPDAQYGLQLTSSDPDKGHLIAIFTPDPVDFGENIEERTMVDIPRSEALSDYLPRLVSALAGPINTDSTKRNSKVARWSVTTLPFRIVAPLDPSLPRRNPARADESEE
jgi:metacaspase-1